MIFGLSTTPTIKLIFYGPIWNILFNAKYLIWFLKTPLIEDPSTYKIIP